MSDSKRKRNDEEDDKMRLTIKQEKELLKLRDEFYTRRHGETLKRMTMVEKLIILRFRLATDLVSLKDSVSMKNFDRQMKLIETKYDRFVKKVRE
jgi:hypothetical protein